jgi:hypothetical protein
MRTGRVVVAAALAATTACGGGGGYTATLPPAGSTGAEKGIAADDGTGQLAQASVKFTTGPSDERFDEFADANRVPISNYGYDEFGGYVYGGDEYGGGMYGGTNYANYNPYQWGYGQQVNRQVEYTVGNLADAGAITGTVSWASAPAARTLSSPCGEIANPSLRLGAKNEAGGAIVYLEQVTQGRPLPYGNKPLETGGMVEKTPCALRPAAQVVSPAPTVITVFNDENREVVVAKNAKAEPLSVKLSPGGFKQVAIALGVTTIADESGKLAPAHIVAPGHPYFTITDDSGKFKIGDVVPGTYKLVVWHPPVVTAWRDGKPVYGAAVTVSKTVKVTAYGTTKSDVSLK